MPRWLELFIAIGLVIFLSPLFVILMIAIMADSSGWPLFFQQRVGKNGNLFWLIKFRKMPITVPPDGKGITTNHDIRLTRMGRLLERFKLDEWPQLINVIKGEMALVGPRPELPKFTQYYTDKWQKIVTVRPGVVGYSQVKIPHENDLYPPDCIDHESYYIEHILPEKLDNELDYIEHRSLLLDLSILVRVTIALLTKTITPNWIFVHCIHSLVLFSDILVSLVSLYIGFFLIQPTFVMGDFHPKLYRALLVSLMAKPFIFYFFGLHRQSIFSLITLNMFITIVRASAYSSLSVILIMMMFFERDLVIRAHLIDLLLLPILLIGIRLTYVLIYESFISKDTFRSKIQMGKHLLIMLGYGGLGFVSYWLPHLFLVNNLALRWVPIFKVSLCVFVIRCILSHFMWPPSAKTWRAFVGREMLNNFHVTVIGTGLILLTNALLQYKSFSRVALLIDIAQFVVLTSLVSLIWCIHSNRQKAIQRPVRAIILGAGIGTELFLSSIQRLHIDNINIVGIITDIEWKRFSSVQGVRVIGQIGDVEALIELYRPHMLITWETLEGKSYKDFIVGICRKYNVDFQIAPNIDQILVKS